MQPKVITQAHFGHLPRLLQEGVLHLWGVYITALETEQGYQALYNVSDFYVEVLPESGSAGARMACFTNADRLLVYLQAPLRAKEGNQELARGGSELKRSMR